MTLPNGTTISMQQIRDEYGMGNPISMSQLYGKPGIPGSGQLSFSTFWGKSGAATFNYAPGTYDVGDSAVVLSASYAVTWTWSKTGHATASATPASGSSSTNLYMSPPAPAGTSQVRQATFNVSAAGNSWTFRMVVQGGNGGGTN